MIAIDMRMHSDRFESYTQIPSLSFVRKSGVKYAQPDELPQNIGRNF